jgi:hypothetical protein
MGSKDDRKKVSINKETYDKLKNYSRYNALKLRLVIDAMIDAVAQDEELSKRIIESAVLKEADDN